MEEREAFMFFRSYAEAGRALEKNEDKGRFFSALIDYALDNVSPTAENTPDYIVAIFKAVKPNIDYHFKKAKNGAKGGKAKKSKYKVEANESKPEANESKPEANESKPEAIKTKEQGIKTKEEIDTPSHTPPLKKWEMQFEEFWKEYPRKVGKGAAKRAFEKVIKTVTLETLVNALRRQKCGSQWTRDNGQYIPHPATWLNQQRWEDEVDGGVGSDKPTGTSKWNLHTDI